jgi:transcriptional regulator with XRE-family HTH domain
VGHRLRAARQEAGLSLSEVARRAGVGKGSVSELEHGRRPPRLETLWALSTAIGVPLSRLVDSDGGEATAGASVRATLLDRWTSDAFYELYRASVGTRRQTSPAHAPNVSEILTVLTGRLRAGPVREPATAGPGESIQFRSDSPHIYQAIESPCEITIVIRYG